MEVRRWRAGGFNIFLPPFSYLNFVRPIVKRNSDVLPNVLYLGGRQFKRSGSSNRKVGFKSSMGFSAQSAYPLLKSDALSIATGPQSIGDGLA